MQVLEENLNILRQYRRANLTYQQISALFQENFPEIQRGFSARSVCSICTKATNAEVDQIVQTCVNEAFKIAKRCSSYIYKSKPF